MNDDLEVRGAREDEARLLAWTMLAASRSHLPSGVWDHVLDVSAVERAAILIEYAKTEQRHSAHYSRFRVACVDGHSVAALATFAAEEIDTQECTDALVDVLRDRGWSDAQIEAALVRGAPWEAIDVPDSPGAWVIEWVATLPRFRRRGLTRRLLEEALEEGARRGHRVAEMRVAIGNRAAISAYERAGFEVTSVHASPELHARIGLPGIVRMACPLS